MRSLMFPALVALFGSSLCAADAEDNTFFEQKIRPVLVRHCYSCHSAHAKNLRGGLLLDTRSGIRKGGDTGAAVVPGKVAESLIIDSLKYESFEMPPSGKLPEHVIADFEKWITLGAPDPRIGTAVATREREIDLAAGRQFWSFQPIVSGSPPTIRDRDWPRNAIDRYIKARLESEQITPSQEADKRTFIRRLYFDLIGLPAGPEAIKTFLADPSHGAIEKLVDRLLASSRFGERWGRHWLDVARFSQSTGGGRSLLYNEAWRYRDYVINAYNRDKPFDEFITEQIAGDLLPAGDYRERAEHLIATAFLLLGATNYEQQDKEQLRMDVIDEQIQVVGTALLGMTLGCARCHDHKFDPIPTNDYYALAGIFRSTKSLTPGNVSGWTKRPLPLSPEQLQQRREFERQLAQATKQKRELQQQIDALRNQLPVMTLDDADAKLVGNWNGSTSVKKFLGERYLYGSSGPDGEKSARFQPDLTKPQKMEVLISYAPFRNRATRVPVTISHALGKETVLVNQRKKPPIDNQFISLGTYPFSGAGGEHVQISTNGTNDGCVIVDAVRFVSKAEPNPELQRVEDDLAKLQDELSTINKQIQEMQSHTSKKPSQVIALAEAEEIGDYHRLIRGNSRNPGDIVPRGFLQVAMHRDLQVKIPAGQSGRLQLANWIASADNPLTARVYVNRIWSHLFGSGLVRTVDNFGTKGERPSHPQLLDYLAGQLIENNWSTKKLIREIVLSKTYRLSSQVTEQQRKRDPANHYFAHQNQRRLEAEAIRDAILQVSGQLDLTMGGQTIRAGTKSEYGYTFSSNRRSVYLPVFRNRLHDLLATFDFPDPNLAKGQRNVSTLSTQALYLMNSPFVLEQSRNLAMRLIEAEPDAHTRIKQLYQLALGRLPSIGESRFAATFLEKRNVHDPSDTIDSWSALCQVVMASIDFRYVK